MDTRPIMLFSRNRISAESESTPSSESILIKILKFRRIFRLLAVSAARAKTRWQLPETGAILKCLSSRSAKSGAFPQLGLNLSFGQDPSGETDGSIPVCLVFYRAVVFNDPDFRRLDTVGLHPMEIHGADPPSAIVASVKFPGARVALSLSHLPNRLMPKDLLPSFPCASTCQTG